MVNRIDGERSVNGCYHILTGKKSAQSIQDAWLYGFTSWYGLFPDWPMTNVQQKIAQLIEKKQMTQDKLVQLLHTYDFERRAFLAKTSQWMGTEAVAFSKKFNLLSQVISHYLANQQNYIPVIKDIEAQLAVKRFWRSLPDKYTFAKQLSSELYNFLEHLDDDLLATLVVERLSGYQIHGRSFQQLATKMKIPLAILELYYYQVILLFMEYCLKHNLSLQFLIRKRNVKTSGLTLSAQKTFSLLQQGYELAEISKLRQLKQNTIEDHLIEIAIHVTDYDFSTFISPEMMEQVKSVMNRLKTRKLSRLKEHLPAEISYFQLRLALVLAGRETYQYRKV